MKNTTIIRIKCVGGRINVRRVGRSYEHQGVGVQKLPNAMYATIDEAVAAAEKIADKRLRTKERLTEAGW
jgi:acyl-CoA synthetase (NDP forming)